MILSYIYLLQDLEITEEEKHCVLDFRPYMNRTPYIVNPVSIYSCRKKGLRTPQSSRLLWNPHTFSTSYTVEPLIRDHSSFDPFSTTACLPSWYCVQRCKLHQLHANYCLEVTYVYLHEERCALLPFGTTLIKIKAYHVLAERTVYEHHFKTYHVLAEEQCMNTTLRICSLHVSDSKVSRHEYRRNML